MNRLEINKLVINFCTKRLDKHDIVDAAECLRLLTGQKPVLLKAKVAVSNFKIRKGLPLGYKVTLRRFKASNFINKLLWITWPQDPTFRGVYKSGLTGNLLSFGIRNLDYFPEIKRATCIKGFNVNIVFKKEYTVQELLDLKFPINL